MISNPFHNNKNKNTPQNISTKNKVQDKALYKIFQEPGNSFRLQIGTKDISEQVIINDLRDGYQLAWEESNNRYFLLPPKDKMEYNKAIDTEWVEADDGIVLISFDGFKDLFIIKDNEDISAECNVREINDELMMMWSNADDSYYIIRMTDVDKKIVAAEQNESQNHTIWYKDEDAYYIYWEDQPLAPETKLAIVDDNALAYHEGSRKWLFLEAYQSTNDLDFREAQIFDFEATHIWSKPNELQYYLIAEGEFIDYAEWEAQPVYEHLVIFNKKTKSYFLMRDFGKVAENTFFKLEEIPSNDGLIGFKLPNKGFMVLDGGIGLANIKARKYEEMIIILDEESSRIFISNAYYQSNEYEFFAIHPTDPEQSADMVEFVRSV